MMPQLVTVRVDRPDRRPHPDLGPGAPRGARALRRSLVLAVLAAVVACLVYRIECGAGTRHRLARHARALPGTRFDIEQGRTAVLVAIR